MIDFIIGLLSGMTAALGLGGGFVLIIYLLNFTETSQLKAQGINLLFFLPIALLSIIIHSKNKLIEWKLIPFCVLFGAIGVGAGFAIANWIDENWLSKAFALLLIIVGLKELFHKKATDKSKKT